ncbi:hypothetical protein [Streptomyces sp. NPDC056144]|uniref:hypothetical protein n=1 Tax=unclassified Streptomyces TaxID=2593676 RepID=UPI0035DA91A5
MSAHQLPAPVLLGAFAGTAALAWAAAGRRRGAATVAGTMAGLQGGLHLLFSVTGAHTMAPATAVPHRHPTTGMPAGHAAVMDPAPTGAMDGMASMDAMDGIASMDSMTSMASMASTSSGVGMLAVHLLAALLCGLWLAHGEAAFLTLAEAALAYAFTPLRLLLASVRVPDAPRGPVRRANGGAHRPATVVLAHTVSRRGPPRPAALLATALGAQV